MQKDMTDLSSVPRTPDKQRSVRKAAGPGAAVLPISVAVQGDADPLSFFWGPVSDRFPGRSHSCAVTSGDHVYFIGGFAPGETSAASMAVLRFDLGTQVVTDLTASCRGAVPRGAVHHIAMVFERAGRKAATSPAVAQPPPLRTSSSVASASASASFFREKSPTSPNARVPTNESSEPTPDTAKESSEPANHSAGQRSGVGGGDMIVVAAGWTGSSYVKPSVVHVLDVETLVWSEVVVSGTPPPPVCCASAASLGPRSAVVCGGVPYLSGSVTLSTPLRGGTMPVYLMHQSVSSAGDLLLSWEGPLVTQGSGPCKRSSAAVAGHTLPVRTGTPGVPLTSTMPAAKVYVVGGIAADVDAAEDRRRRGASGADSVAPEASKRALLNDTFVLDLTTSPATWTAVVPLTNAVPPPGAPIAATILPGRWPLTQRTFLALFGTRAVPPVSQAPEGLTQAYPPPILGRPGSGLPLTAEDVTIAPDGERSGGEEGGPEAAVLVVAVPQKKDRGISGALYSMHLGDTSRSCIWEVVAAATQHSNSSSVLGESTKGISDVGPSHLRPRSCGALVVAPFDNRRYFVLRGPGDLSKGTPSSPSSPSAIVSPSIYAVDASSTMLAWKPAAHVSDAGVWFQSPHERTAGISQVARKPRDGATASPPQSTGVPRSPQQSGVVVLIPPLPIRNGVDEDFGLAADIDAVMSCAFAIWSVFGIPVFVPNITRPADSTTASSPPKYDIAGSTFADTILKILRSVKNERKQSICLIGLGSGGSAAIQAAAFDTSLCSCVISINGIPAVGGFINTHVRPPSPSRSRAEGSNKGRSGAVRSRGATEMVKTPWSPPEAPFLFGSVAGIQSPTLVIVTAPLDGCLAMLSEFDNIMAGESLVYRRDVLKSPSSLFWGATLSERTRLPSSITSDETRAVLGNCILGMRRFFLNVSQGTL